MFRFTIRDVLWLTVVVALAVGWWVDRERLRLWARGRWDRTLEATMEVGQLWADERNGEVVIEVSNFFVFHCLPEGESEKPRITISR